MPDITIVPANLAALVLESFLYGLLLLLFISTVYFFAMRRTLAGTRQTARHHFTSLVFLGVAALFLVVTVHWSIVVYKAFYAFIHLGSAVAEDAYYADLAQPTEVANAIFVIAAVLLGDALMTYRLWIIWGRNRQVVIFPILALIGVVVVGIGIILEAARPKPRGIFHTLSKPWEVAGFIVSFLANLYSTGCIIFRICRVTKAKSVSESRLMWFLSILVESAALQTLWFTLTAITLFVNSDVDFILLDNFPAILGISNTLIHARVGLGWSPDYVVAHKQPQSAAKYPQDAV